MDKIFLHYDMDAFFASIEQRDNIKYRDIPIAVGHGVITTASYEARKYGIKSGMSGIEARKLCPNLKFVSCRKNHYENVGKEIQSLIKKITKKCEFMSIDEGFIDITDIITKYESLEIFIKKFKNYIYKNSKLTCSVGIGFSKVSAKIASDIDKPNGYFVFRNREQFLEYISNKKLSIIPGIGKKTREILKQYNIETVSDLYRMEKEKLKEKFGEVRGNYLYNVIRGNHDSEIENVKKSQSYGYEITFNQSMNDERAILEEIKKQVNKLCDRLKRKSEYVKTVTLKIRYSNFTTYTKSKTMNNATRNEDTIYSIARDNYMQMYKRDDVRLIGVHVSGITNVSIVQLTFENMINKLGDKNGIL